MGVLDFLPFGGDDDADGEAGDASGADPDQRGSADFRERAESLTDRSDVPTLDYTVASLEGLDDVAASPAGPDDPVVFGNYLGETLIEAFDAEWTREDGWVVAVELPEDRTTVAVFDAARRSLDGQPVFAAVARKLAADGANTVDQSTATLASADAPSPDPTAVDAASLPTFQRPRSLAERRRAGVVPVFADRTRGGVVPRFRPGATADRIGAGRRDERVLPVFADRTRGGVIPRFEPGTVGGPMPGEHLAGPDAATICSDLAAAVAAEWDLDRSPASLARLDDLLAGRWGDRRAPADGADHAVDLTDPGPIERVGAYLGTVLVAHLGGAWDGRRVALGERTVDPFAIAEDALAGERRLALQCDALANAVGAAATASDGRATVLREGPMARLDHDEAIEAVVDLAAAVAAREDLDYAPRSLAWVDALAREADVPAAPLGEPTDPDSLALTARAADFGAYLAVVLVRHLDAAWLAGARLELLVEGPDGRATVRPVELAAAALRGEASLADSYERLRTSLDVAAPPVA